MKLALAIGILFTIASCGPSKEELERRQRLGTESPEKAYSYSDTPTGISVIKIDGCEYVYCEVSEGVSIVHKQNCKNHYK